MFLGFNEYVWVVGVGGWWMVMMVMRERNAMMGGGMRWTEETAEPLVQPITHCASKTGIYLQTPLSFFPLDKVHPLGVILIALQGYII